MLLTPQAIAIHHLIQSEFRTALLSVMKIQALEPTTSYLPGLDDQYAAVPEYIQDILNCARSELTQYFHLQGSSFVGGIVGDICTLINYCQKAVMVTSSERSDLETSRIWDTGGQKKRLSRERDGRSLEPFRSQKCLSKNYARPLYVSMIHTRKQTPASGRQGAGLTRSRVQ